MLVLAKTLNGLGMEIDRKRIICSGFEVVRRGKRKRDCQCCSVSFLGHRRSGDPSTIEESAKN